MFSFGHGLSSRRKLLTHCWTYFGTEASFFAQFQSPAYRPIRMMTSSLLVLRLGKSTSW